MRSMSDSEKLFPKDELRGGGDWAHFVRSVRGQSDRLVGGPRKSRAP
jgi:hypothetical protein